MPIYEYDCQDCEKTVSVLFLSISEAENEEAACPECGRKNLSRLVSGASVIRSRGDGAGRNSAKTPESDSRSLAEAMREQGRGRDYGDDFREVAHRLEKGEKADSIEKSLRARVGEKMQAH